ncbi:uncharacterized protein LOC100900806 [Galendromus occidentalis]|uniref:Uncharacterized protein LOC100900806 n=1 Tax=Galendromus occidentalis TaxID=34638 RepID=A0AAJ7SIK2_9ACAR|nr:uncharacterized protein LOC100900806 [Galendromus occidentalis]
MNSMLDVPRDSRQKSRVQYRHILSILGFFGLFCMYVNRVNINVALVAMVHKPHNASAEFHPSKGNCPLPSNHSSAFSDPRNSLQPGPFDWDTYTQGLIRGAFYYGYIITGIPGGRLAERYGAKWLFGLGTLITALFNFIIPTLAYHGGAPALITVRAIQGFCEGVTFPAAEAQCAHWYPISERTTGIAFMHAGGFLGATTGLWISGVLAGSSFLGGWPSVFYFSGTVALIWFVFWTVLASDRPGNHPFISQDELDYIHAGLGDDKPINAEHTPWRRILTSRGVWALICAHFGVHWLHYMLISELPTYLARVLHFNVEKGGLYTALPYIGASILGAFAGPCADYIRSRRILTATNTRKLFNGVSMFIPSIVLIIVVHVAACDGVTSLILFVIAGTIRGISEAGYISVPVDLAPDYAGTIFGLCMTIGNTTGFIVPWITAIFIHEEQTTTAWARAFYTAGAVGITTGIIFHLFGTAETQDWGLASRPIELKSKDDGNSETQGNNLASSIPRTRILVVGSNNSPPGFPIPPPHFIIPSKPLFPNPKSWSNVRAWIQYRYVLIILGFFGLASVYGMRVNINVAMVVMVNQSAIEAESPSLSCEVVTANGTGAAPKVEVSYRFRREINTHRFRKELVTCRNTVPKTSSRDSPQDGPFQWDRYSQGFILGAFYYGYLFTPIPGGRLAERFGAKWLFGFGTLITGLLSLLIPYAAFNYGAAGVVTLRVLQGLGEGVTYPSMEAQVAHWLPVGQRTTGIALIHTGGFFGVVAGMAISGILADSNIMGGWPSVFYCFGIWSIIWFIFWAIFVSNRPDDHPWASQEEVDLISNDLGTQKPTHASYTPWRKILTSPPVIAVGVAQFGANWLQYTLVTELPNFLGTVLHFNIKDNGIYSSLPYLGAMVAGATAGPVADYLRRHEYMTNTNIRKLFNGMALFGPSVLLIFVTWIAGCDGGLSLLIFVIAGTLRGFCEAGYMSAPVDMAPDYAGTILGITVCVSQTTGFLVPWITGLLTQKENSLTAWSYTFYVTACIGFVCGLFFQLYSSSEIQEWGLAPRDEPAVDQNKTDGAEHSSKM